jgi:hypothetical protein
MKKIIALTTVFVLGAIGLACGDSGANNAATNANKTVSNAGQTTTNTPTTVVTTTANASSPASNTGSAASNAAKQQVAPSDKAPGNASAAIPANANKK